MFSRRSLLLGFAALGLPHGVRAQGLSNRPITIVVPYPPGGPIDTLARVIAQEAAPALDQPVVVENRPGGSGIIGTNAVARAEPDGHMLVLGTNQTHATNQSLIKNCPYDAVRDFAPVAGIAAMPHVLVVRKDLPASSLADVVALAKAQARQPDLRFDRQRLGRASRGRTVQDPRRHRHAARAVQGPVADAHRGAGRPHRHEHRARCPA